MFYWYLIFIVNRKILVAEKASMPAVVLLLILYIFYTNFGNETVI